MCLKQALCWRNVFTDNNSFSNAVWMIKGCINEQASTFAFFLACKRAYAHELLFILKQAENYSVSSYTHIHTWNHRQTVFQEVWPCCCSLFALPQSGVATSNIWESCQSGLAAQCHRFSTTTVSSILQCFTECVLLSEYWRPVLDTIEMDHNGTHW